MIDKNKKWEDLPREDLNMIPAMQKAGWTVEFDEKDKRHQRIFPYNVPHDSVSFKKGNVTIWSALNGSVQNGNMEWRTADLIDGYYKNHRWHKTLSEAIEKEENNGSKNNNRI